MPASAVCDIAEAARHIEGDASSGAPCIHEPQNAIVEPVAIDVNGLNARGPGQINEREATVPAPT